MKKVSLVSLNYFDMDYCTEIGNDSIELHSWSIVKSRIKTLYNLFCFVEMRSKHYGLYVLRNLLIQFKLDAIGYQNVYVEPECIIDNKLFCIEYLFVREPFDLKNVTDNYF